MSCHYCILQYVDDPVRNEGRNIGVVVHSNDSACMRAIGFDGTDTDVSYFEALSAKTKGCGWIYREWMDWFTDLLEFEGRSLDGFKAYIGRLDGGNFIVKSGGYLDGLPEDEEEGDAVTYLFSNLVTLPQRRREPGFAVQVEDIIRRAELPLRPDFDQDLAIEFFPETGSPVTVSLPYVLMDAPRTLFKTVNPHSGLESLTRQINDAVFTFETAVAAGFAAKDRCIVLTDTLGKVKAPYLRRLATHAHLIEISDRLAINRIKAIIATGTSPHGKGPSPLL
ncbi:MAG: hypothetical protein PHF56_11480 [Desulfuromonadaceae bacterium]|nr:hypothetical protein [Desulfuromonadaceae bacterium]